MFNTTRNNLSIRENIYIQKRGNENVDATNFVHIRKFAAVIRNTFEQLSQ